MKKNKHINFWRITFLILIVVPSLVWKISGGSSNAESAEKRELAKKPELTAENFREFPEEYNNYYNDHLPFRDLLIKGNSLLSYKLFKTSANGNVLVGKENWLFYTLKGMPMDPVADYKGILNYDENYMTASLERLKTLQKMLEEKGTQLILMIPPNKEAVYSEYLPDAVKQVRKTSQTDALLDFYEQNSSLKIVNPKKEFLKNKKKYQLYYQQDTHWNLLGAYIGEQQILETLYKQRGHLDEQKISARELISRPSAEKDLALMLNLQDWFNNDHEFVIEKYQDFKDWDKVRFHNKDAVHDERVLFIGDSFRNSLKPYLSADFSNVLVSEEYNTGKIESYQPTVVILEYVERNSGNIINFEIP